MPVSVHAMELDDMSSNTGWFSSVPGDSKFAFDATWVQRLDAAPRGDLLDADVGILVS